MMVAGDWLRPAFYGAEADRERLIAEEAAHVRRAVGLIDVSTLGGIEIRGARRGPGSWTGCTPSPIAARRSAGCAMS